jgi:hypothetical protein
LGRGAAGGLFGFPWEGRAAGIAKEIVAGRLGGRFASGRLGRLLSLPGEGSASRECVSRLCGWSGRWGRGGWRLATTGQLIQLLQAHLGLGIVRVDAQHLRQAVAALFVCLDNARHPDPGSFAARVGFEHLRDQLLAFDFVTSFNGGNCLLEQLGHGHFSTNKS